MHKLKTTHLSNFVAMDYMFPSRTNENLSCLTSSEKLIIHHENLNLTQQDPHPPLFLPFPPPFLDDMVTHDAETTIIATQNHNHPSKFKTATATTTERLDSKLKCVRRKRSAGKKDRHSKIHTAQGLRDRRMRLSVHTARKFFDLNDMLGFDKASKTIEWLFSKSKKAIDEVTENLQPDDHAAALTVISGENTDIESPLSATCETESVIEIATVADQNDENLELQDDPIIENSSISKPMESYPLMVPELSGKEGRARVEIERTSRDRSILENNNNQHVEKLKQLFEAADDPRINNFHQSQLGFLEHHHNNMKESSSSSTCCYPLEFSNTYHFLKHLHLDSNTDDHSYNNLGNITSSSIPATNPSSIFDYNKTTHVITEPPAGWLNSKNTFLGFLGGWDSEINSRLMGSNNGGSIVPNINAPLIMMSRENNSSSSGIISSNYTNLHSENQGQ